MDRTHIKLDDKAFKQKYNQIMFGNKGKKIGLIIFVITLIVFVIGGFAWSQGWFEFLNHQPEPFCARISDMRESADGFATIYVNVEGDGRMQNVIPAEIRLNICLYENGTLKSTIEDQLVDIITKSLNKSIERGFDFKTPVKHGSYEITPFIYYYDSNEEKKTITEKTQTYIWDEKGFYKEES